MEKKITKKQVFEALIGAVTGMDKVGDIDAEIVIATLETAVAQIDAKAAKAKERAAAKKAEADVLYDQVKDALSTEEFQTIADIAAVVAEVNADATVSKTTYRLTKLVEAGLAEKTQVTIPAVDGGKARKVQAYRLVAQA